jgi:hypothetical protein
MGMGCRMSNKQCLFVCLLVHRAVRKFSYVVRMDLAGYNFDPSAAKKVFTANLCVCCVLLWKQAFC